MMEVFKRITEGDSYYEVSNLGRVRRYVKSTGKYKFIKGGIHPKGYHRIKLGKLGSAYVHRLVAKSFVDNPNNKPDVNHLDGNKLNNTSSNLEWCTAIENNIHACEVLGITVIIPVYVVNWKNEIVASFDSKNQLAKSNISTDKMFVIPKDEYCEEKFNELLEFQNNKKRKKHKKVLVGHGRKFTNEQVIEIKKLLSLNMKDQHIAKYFGCNSYSIKCIKDRKTYLDVE